MGPKEYFYSEIEGGFGKNHRTDGKGRRSEKGGVIPFAVTDHGLNPGRFIEQVSEKMSENEFLFQRPRRESKYFDIHNPEVTTYFENSKVGVHLVGDMMPKVSNIFLFKFLNKFAIGVTYHLLKMFRKAANML